MEPIPGEFLAKRSKFSARDTNQKVNVVGRPGFSKDPKCNAADQCVRNPLALKGLNTRLKNR